MFIFALTFSVIQGYIHKLCHVKRAKNSTTFTSFFYKKVERKIEVFFKLWFCRVDFCYNSFSSSVIVLDTQGLGLKETGQALIVYCHFVIIVMFVTVLVTLGSLNVKHWVSLHKVSHNAVIISFLELFQQLFFKFDENLKMVLNQFISVSQGVKNEIDKWIFGFEYATILLKKKNHFYAS